MAHILPKGYDIQDQVLMRRLKAGSARVNGRMDQQMIMKDDANLRSGQTILSGRTSHRRRLSSA
ncbi:hypothetical protein AB0F68_06800 [Micromonospora sp. NPDC023966]|uniref:hypothetical protein n=1 Tax=Micromonospora sp. NPDC023966 TaxID=3154699 RepID=UPI0033F70C21